MGISQNRSTTFDLFMTHSSVTLAWFCLFALLSRTTTGFTISLAPLLTAHFGLSSWRSNYVNNFSAPAPRSSMESSGAMSTTEVHTKPVVDSFKFEYEDIQMLSNCKKECLELV